MRSSSAPGAGSETARRYTFSDKHREIASCAFSQPSAAHAADSASPPTGKIAPVSSPGEHDLYGRLRPARPTTDWHLHCATVLQKEARHHIGDRSPEASRSIHIGG